MAVIIPLPRIVEDNPAPANTPGLDVAETAQADKPNDPAANLALGYSYYRAKAYADAARTFEKAARLAPKDPIPLLYLGYTQMAVGALDGALTTFESVAALPGVTGATKSEAFLQIGNIRGAFNDPERAMEAFQRSLKENPKQGRAPPPSPPAPPNSNVSTRPNAISRRLSLFSLPDATRRKPTPPSDASPNKKATKPPPCPPTKKPPQWTTKTPGRGMASVG